MKRTTAMATWAVLLAASLLLGCGQGFTPASFVDQLRILAVRAEAPELRPGETTRYTALVVDPGGREISILWARCNLEGAVADLLQCQKPENLIPLGAGPSIDVTAPADYLDTGPNAPQDRRYMYIFLAVQAGDDQILAFKETLVTREEQPLDQNPILTGVRVFSPDDPETDLTAVSPGQVVRLAASYPPESRETYLYQGEDRTEDMLVSWFADGGEMDRNRTVNEEQNAWLAPTQAGTVRFWVVLRDGRNGTDWRTFTLPVQ